MGTNTEYRDRLRHRCDDPDCYQCEQDREGEREEREAYEWEEEEQDVYFQNGFK